MWAVCCHVLHELNLLPIFPARCGVVFLATEIPDDPYIESTGYWQDISVDQSDDDVWKTTDMGWGVYPEGMRKMLNYIQVGYCWGAGAVGLLGLVAGAVATPAACPQQSFHFLAQLQLLVCLCLCY